jgi:hypothetical protein
MDTYIAELTPQHDVVIQLRVPPEFPPKMDIAIAELPPQLDVAVVSPLPSAPLCVESPSTATLPDTV